MDTSKNTNWSSWNESKLNKQNRGHANKRKNTYPIQNPRYKGLVNRLLLDRAEPRAYNSALSLFLFLQTE